MMSAGEPKWWKDIMIASAHWNRLSKWQQDEIIRQQSMAEIRAVKIPIMRDHSLADIEIPVKKLTDDAILPTKAYEYDAGFDLYSIKDEEIDNLSKISTGVAVAIPEGYFGLICDRSSLGSKGVKVFGGVIDSTYRGEIFVCLGAVAKFNYVKLPKGSKIAQLVILPIPTVKLKQVESLDSTDRGEKGFGSSGS